jgi:predicted nucleic acid-binding protein
VSLFYADASALVKLVRDEPESPALRAFIAEADLASCDLVLAEVPRAIRRAAALDPRLGLEVLIARAGEVIDSVALVPLDRALLLAAGALSEPSLRTLDAIHVAAAASLTSIDALGYDDRRAARPAAGLRTFAPGVSEPVDPW